VFRSVVAIKFSNQQLYIQAGGKKTNQKTVNQAPGLQLFCYSGRKISPRSTLPPQDFAILYLYMFLFLALFGGEKNFLLDQSGKVRGGSKKYFLSRSVPFSFPSSFFFRRVPPTSLSVGRPPVVFTSQSCTTRREK